VLDVTRETDIERLRSYAQLQEIENRLLRNEISRLLGRLAKAEGSEATQLQLEIDMLAERMATQAKRMYGTSSERRGKSSPNDDNRVAQRGHGPGEQRELLTEEVIHSLPDDEQVCTACGGQLEEMTGQFDEAEEVDVIERSFRLLIHRRKKYRCRCGECIKTAPGPQRLVPGGRYSIDFGCTTAVAKYLDHAPLARQVRQMKREGLNVTTQTLWDQINALARHLAPTYERLITYVRESPVIGADETTWRLMDANNAKKKWWAWSMVREDAVVYMIQASRGTDAAERLLEGYQGTIVCDGYAAYSALKKRRASAVGEGGPSPPVLANCWAHARRKFIEAEPFDARAIEVLDLIGQLYAVEAEVRDATAKDRMRARQQRSAKIVEQIRAWMYAQRALPRSALGRAIKYVDGLWKGLVVFLDDPAVPIHNNDAERGMRSIAIGRKNHFGSRSMRGTEVAALFYTLLESAKMAGVDPAEYLRVTARRAIANPGTITLPRELRDN